MFKLSRKKMFVRLSIICVFVATAISVATILAVRNNDLNSNAATGQDSTVTVNGGHRIDYGVPDVGHTQTYSITNSDGETIRAYCAEPSAAWPGDSTTTAEYASNTEKYNKIKLMIFLQQHQNSATKTALDKVWQNWRGDGSSGETAADEEYAWTHAIVGAIYTNGTDYRGVEGNDRVWVDKAVTELGKLITNNDDVWVMAQNYQLFIGKGAGDKQDVVWIEGKSQYGTINVQKCDKTTNECTPQGNASLGSITFKVYNDSGKKIYNPKTGEVYNDGAVVATGRTDSNGKVTFSNLLATGIKYKVAETATNTSYELTAGEQTTTLSTSGQTVNLKFYDKVKTGKVTVNKIDADTGSCTTTGDLSFDGTTFKMTNESDHPIYYGDKSVAVHGEVSTKRLENGACKVEFSNLPYGDYKIEETFVSEGYVVKEKTKTVTVGANSVNVSTTFENYVKRGDVKFVKMDGTNNKPLKNVLFSITALDKNNNAKEVHLVVSDENGVVDTSSSFIPHSRNTNGYDPLFDELDPIVFSGYGTWFGIDHNGNNVPVRDDRGALPYGTYIIEELKCGANMFCTGVKDQKKTITINSDNQVIDLQDWNNACAKFSLETTATDAKDDDKYVEIAKEVKIKDKIEYCVKPRVDFTIKGVLMDKATGEKLLINGEPVEETITLNSETDCGETEMIFTIDATELGGKELVVFETLYYKEDIITSHEDINDDAQTVEMIYLKTYASNNLTGEKTLPANSYAEIKDVVKYCLKPGVEYTIKGVLMNKETSESVKIDDEPVTSMITFTPEEACGELEMLYKLNTTGLDGASLVIFESLYIDEEEILQHSDLSDADQTVTVEVPEPVPTPDTGLFTGRGAGATESGNVMFVMGVVVFVGLGGYISVRAISRKGIFKKKIDF